MVTVNNSTKYMFLILLLIFLSSISFVSSEDAIACKNNLYEDYYTTKLLYSGSPEQYDYVFDSKYMWSGGRYVTMYFKCDQGTLEYNYKVDGPLGNFNDIYKPINDKIIDSIKTNSLLGVSGQDTENIINKIMSLKDKKNNLIVEGKEYKCNNNNYDDYYSTKKFSQASFLPYNISSDNINIYYMHFKCDSGTLKYNYSRATPGGTLFSNEWGLVTDELVDAIKSEDYLSPLSPTTKDIDEIIRKSGSKINDGSDESRAASVSITPPSDNGTPAVPVAPATPAAPAGATTNNLPIGTSPRDNGTPPAPDLPRAPAVAPATSLTQPAAVSSPDGYTCTIKDVGQKYTLTLNGKEYEQEIKGIKTVNNKTYFRIPYPSVPKPSCLTDNVPNQNSCKETTCTVKDLASSFGEQYAATYYAPWKTGNVNLDATKEVKYPSYNSTSPRYNSERNQKIYSLKNINNQLQIIFNGSNILSNPTAGKIYYCKMDNLSEVYPQVISQGNGTVTYNIFWRYNSAYRECFKGGTSKDIDGDGISNENDKQPEHSDTKADTEKTDSAPDTQDASGETDNQSGGEIQVDNVDLSYCPAYEGSPNVWTFILCVIKNSFES